MTIRPHPERESRLSPGLAKPVRRRGCAWRLSWSRPLNADSPLRYYRAIETRDSSIEPAGAPMERGVAIGIGVGVAVSIAALIFLLLFLLGTGIT